jgi:hypothetical protein
MVSPATDMTTPVPTNFPGPLPTTIRSIEGWTFFTALQVVSDIHATAHPPDDLLTAGIVEAVAALVRWVATVLVVPSNTTGFEDVAASATAATAAVRAAVPTTPALKRPLRSDHRARRRG